MGLSTPVPQSMETNLGQILKKFKCFYVFFHHIFFFKDPPPQSFFNYDEKKYENT